MNVLTIWGVLGTLMRVWESLCFTIQLWKVMDMKNSVIVWLGPHPIVQNVPHPITQPPRGWYAREVQKYLGDHRKVQRFCGLQSTVQWDVAVTLCQSGGSAILKWVGVPLGVAKSEQT